MYDQHYQKPWTDLKSTQKHNYREIYSSQLCLRVAHPRLVRWFFF